MKLSAAAAFLFVASCWPAPAQHSGAALYAQHCAACHDAGNPQSRVPSRNALQLMSYDHVLWIITSGSMADMAKERTDDERKAIASFVTGRISSGPPPTVGNEASAECTNRSLGFGGPLYRPQWNGWGADLSNSRFQPAEMARLAPDEVPRLQLKWAFGFPGLPRLTPSRPSSAACCSSAARIANCAPSTRRADARSGPTRRRRRSGPP